MVKKRSRESEYDDSEHNLVEKRLKDSTPVNFDKRLIIILENAQLETAKVAKKFELLHSKHEISLLKKYNRERETTKPEIVHQCLLMLLDSPLNRQGFLQVYIHTDKNVLIEVNPGTRIPRTFKRFAGVMAQLLHSNKVRAAGQSVDLLKVIKNPVTDYLPANCKKILMSCRASTFKYPEELVPDEEPVAIVVGAIDQGQVKTDYTDSTIAINDYSSSGAYICASLCSAFARKWM
ncbi:ribosomal RNA small subunit methyltransferase NEP1 [Microplitis demolitor]|uniref:ribosomal RNA small subunit methyltransferase NEP1 n=1 Tax=Microplitis demolitor TaxID=69319 RepID=UPI0004CCA17F|nr:ribosomal RNA small subunit methyltransferase NEP1 [Microplitis demolitor]